MKGDDLRYNFRANFGWPFDYYGDCSGTITDLGHNSEWTGTMLVDRDPSKDRPFRVIGTDYDNFYVKYMCKDYHGVGHSLSWAVMAREKELSRGLTSDAERIIEDAIPGESISNWDHHETNHQWCDYDWKDLQTFSIREGDYGM